MTICYREKIKTYSYFWGELFQNTTLNVHLLLVKSHTKLARLLLLSSTVVSQVRRYC